MVPRTKKVEGDRGASRSAEASATATAVELWDVVQSWPKRPRIAQHERRHHALRNSCPRRALSESARDVTRAIVTPPGCHGWRRSPRLGPPPHLPLRSSLNLNSPTRCLGAVSPENRGGRPKTGSLPTSSSPLASDSIHAQPRVSSGAGTLPAASLILD